MSTNTFIYILVMAAVTFFIRFMPILLTNGRIKSPFIQSFLYYVPTVTLAAMTVPSIIRATQSPIAGAAALAAGAAAAWRGKGLFVTAIICCATVFLLELILV